MRIYEYFLLFSYLLRLMWLSYCVVDLKSMDELRSSISQLYSQLNVEKYQLERERDLQALLDDLHQQIEPYEKVHHTHSHTLLKSHIKRA